ncbi:hypothetical protein ISS42_03120 [Candidatus Shapirobacteria bacterium]|nr:hypothetical protein [Candidatus Shapirobacteria bacterium]
MSGITKKYPIDFGVLVLGLAILASVFFRSSHLPITQEKIIFLASFFYFLWGVGHHLIRGDFHFKLLVEYFLVAAFAAGAGYLVLSQV